MVSHEVSGSQVGIHPSKAIKGDDPAHTQLTEGQGVGCMRHYIGGKVVPPTKTAYVHHGAVTHGAGEHWYISIS